MYLSCIKPHIQTGHTGIKVELDKKSPYKSTADGDKKSFVTFCQLRCQCGQDLNDCDFKEFKIVDAVADPGLVNREGQGSRRRGI